MSLKTSETCNTPGDTGKVPHLRCPACQNQIRRDTKRFKNRYRAHGPMQTATTRAHSRRIA